MQQFILVFVFMVGTFVPGNWACKSIEELDDCAYMFSFLSNREIPVPSTDADVIDHCNKAKAGVKCLLDQAKDCMKGAFKSVTIKVMGDLEKHLHSHCDSPDHRAEFLKHMQCFHDASKADAIRLCADRHMVMMEKVLGIAKPHQLGGVCCSSHQLRECAIGQITSLCSGESGEYFNDMIDEVVEENMELMCQQFTNLAACDAKFDPAIWADFKSINAITDSSQLVKQHHFKTFVPIIVKLIRGEGAR